MPGCDRKSPQGLSQVRPGLASSQFGYEQSLQGTGWKPLPSYIPRHHAPSSASWRNMEGAEFSVSSCILLAAVESSLSWEESQAAFLRLWLDFLVKRSPSVAGIAGRESEVISRCQQLSEAWEVASMAVGLWGEQD